MNEDEIQRTAKRIAEKVMDAVVDETPLNHSLVRDIAVQAIGARAPVPTHVSMSHSSWAIDRLHKLATFGEPWDQIQACEAIVSCECALLEAAKS